MSSSLFIYIFLFVAGVCWVVSAQLVARARPIATTCLWAPGLCGGPDAPGEARGPSPLRLTFRTARQPWDAVLRGQTLYIALPPHVLPEGSREAFVALLEAAEEQLKCQHVVVVSAIRSQGHKHLTDFFQKCVGHLKKQNPVTQCLFFELGLLLDL